MEARHRPAGVRAHAAKLERLDTRVRPGVVGVDDEAHGTLLVAQLGEPRRGTDEAAEKPGVFARARPAVLLECVGHRHRGRREESGVVDQMAEEGAAGVHGGQRYTAAGSGSAQWELANRVRSGRKQR